MTAVTDRSHQNCVTNRTARQRQRWFTGLLTERSEWRKIWADPANCRRSGGQDAKEPQGRGEPSERSGSYGRAGESASAAKSNPGGGHGDVELYG